MPSLKSVRDVPGQRSTDGHFGHVSADMPPALLRLAERVQLARAARPRHFSPNLFGEPGWDMMLALYVAHGRGYRMTVTEVCFESRVPQTTALRWLEHMESAGMAERRPNALDRRTALISITNTGLATMTAYLQELALILSRE